MSDVTCARCREPWDTYHLRHDALAEVIDYDDRDAYKKWNGKLDTVVLRKRTARELLADDGWVFGSSLYDIRRCPGCPKGAKPAESDARDALGALLAGDDDGLAATLEDFDV